MSIRDERGVVTAFVAITSLGLLAVAGLVVDGGGLLAARREAIEIAGSAARAGAQAIEPDALRRREMRVDHREAIAVARRFLARQGRSGTVSVSNTSVSVTVRIRRPTPLLSLVGIRAVTVVGSGTARLVRGVSEGET